jgi:Zn finger protein HypA/HybF involved in hydrogenase expression
VQVEIDELEKEPQAGEAESPKDGSTKSPEEPKPAEGSIKCRRCGFVFKKEQAVFVQLFGKNGCPKCGHSIE